MQKKFLIPIFCAVIFILDACHSPRLVINNVSPHNSKNSIDWNGVYSGTLPCTDCEGTPTMIQINKDGSYIIEKLYPGKIQNITRVAGTYRWNITGNNIIFDVDKNTTPAYYSIGENKITQLDLEGNENSGAAAERYILQKQPAIVEKYWKLIELNGNVVSNAITGPEPHLILKAIENRALGNGGCNGFFGTYQIMEGNRIAFSQMAATKMACQNLETENQLFRVFEMADNYTLVNDTLSLNKARMAPLAKFVAVVK
ncbi:MAG: META domain-containing protein [Ferruginibacter sp.]